MPCWWASPWSLSLDPSLFREYTAWLGQLQIPLFVSSVSDAVAFPLSLFLCDGPFTQLFLFFFISLSTCFHSPFVFMLANRNHHGTQHHLELLAHTNLSPLEMPIKQTFFLITWFVVFFHWFLKQQVKSQGGCLRACTIENEFICRSVLFRPTYKPGQPNCALYHLDHKTFPDGMDTFTTPSPLPLFDSGETSAVYLESSCSSEFFYLQYSVYFSHT